MTPLFLNSTSSWLADYFCVPAVIEKQQQNTLTLGNWIFLSLALLVLIACIFIWGKYSKKLMWPFEKIAAFISGLFGPVPEDISDYETFEQVIKTAGYAYDWSQDIFYSRLDAWQREMGYCRLYDEASATFGMIIDCEPIYFEYDTRKWLIEFWKGQYDLTTG